MYRYNLIIIYRFNISTISIDIIYIGEYITLILILFVKL